MEDLELEKEFNGIFILKNETAKYKTKKQEDQKASLVEAPF